ncbi:arylamine N-acetyltransferase [Salibacterium halotolerans]|uniref:Arylamine N-acetyltransferase n=1 Tax=Salibacterium halotolerans TaxID=1884432 RepID=A0A1I5UJC4_9BACI|nr:arylamine N-acetyltransferase [Salibacterium halotolerans]SFP95137.1 Arylamine N-acetyltransferase [Salibacterium halotolerans]
MSRDWLERYLTILRLKQQPPSRKFLKRIIRAHVRTFPFENVSKLLLARDGETLERVTDVHAFLASHETNQSGGTCFTLNACLFQLLEALGFEGWLIRPGEEHMAVIIKDPGSANRLLYVDVGTTAPLFEPIPFQGRKRAIPPFAGEQLFFLPGEGKGVYSYIRTRNGQITHKKWTFSIYEAMSYADFAPWIAATFQQEASFMNMLRCQLWEPDQRRGLSLINRTFTIRHGNGSVMTKDLPDEEAVRDVLVREFRMPDLPVYEALQQLEQRGAGIFSRT